MKFLREMSVKEKSNTQKSVEATLVFLFIALFVHSGYGLLIAYEGFNASFYILMIGLFFFFFYEMIVNVFRSHEKD